MISYWIDESAILSNDEISNLSKLVMDGYKANEGNSPDKIASIVVDNDNILLQCDKYTLSITSDDLVYSNCTDELLNTMSASILENSELKKYLLATNINCCMLSLLRNHLDEKIAAIILGVLVFDIYMFTSMTK